jgi:enoyl-CoA hydratase/carnithine racemase
MIRSEERDRVRLLLLARPEKRNAFDAATATALIEALRATEAAPEVAAIVLAGEGPGFSAGADLGELRAIAGDPEARAARAALSEALLLAPGAIGKPVVAAVHGAALGAGAALALCCDRLLLAEDATLGFPEALHGMLPALMAPVLLRHLPPRVAFRLLATGAPMTAAEALAAGLAEAVLPAATLRDAACRLALEAATLPPPAMRALKALCAAAPAPLADGLAAARAMRERLA